MTALTTELPDNDATCNAFINAKGRIDRALARLQEASDEHFDCVPDEVNYGDVGTLLKVTADLDEILRFLNLRDE